MISKSIYKLIPLLIFWFLSQLTSSAQVSDSTLVTSDEFVTPVEIAFEEKKVKKSKKRQSPALVASITFVVPGYGQIYNRKYWKLPIVYGAVGGMVYFTSSNQKKYRSYRDDYILRKDPDFTGISAYPNFQDDTIRILRDKYRKKTELNYIWTVGILILQSLDALVDTHLYNFDVSEDISINLFERTTPSDFQNFPLISVSASF